MRRSKPSSFPTFQVLSSRLINGCCWPEELTPFSTSDPTLQGQMVLRLTIEPDGRVSLCVLQGTDMNAPQLSAQVVERVKTFDFGAKDGIPAITILYPIDFLPAT